VADRNPPLHAQGAAAFGDAPQLFDAAQAGFVQMDVDLGGVAPGDAEDHVELARAVAIERVRVDAADHLRAFAHRRIQHLSGAGAGQHPGLRERDQLDVDGAAPAFAHRVHRVQVVQPGGGVDVDMAAHRHRAEPGRLRHQRVGAFDDGGRYRQLLLFDGQALAQGACGAMRMPAVADETLVQVDMAIDQARQHQLPAQVDLLHAVNTRQGRTDGGETAAGDGQLQRRTVGTDGIGEQVVEHGGVVGEGSGPPP